MEWRSLNSPQIITRFFDALVQTGFKFLQPGLLYELYSLTPPPPTRWISIKRDDYQGTGDHRLNLTSSYYYFGTQQGDTLKSGLRSC